jgi:uncharacterized delta-60 repeat protein
VVTVAQRQGPVRAWRRMWAVRWSIAALATSLGLVFGPGQASAQASPGDLDPTFGTGGKVTTDFVGGHDQARALVVQADGRLVAAGIATGEATGLDFALARYNPDGSLDPSFGNGGEVATDFGGFPPDDQAYALVQQADGKLVVAGGVFRSGGDFDNDFALARYNPDGTLDPSFGNGGIVLTDFADGEEAHALALQADGKLVAAGVVEAGGCRTSRWPATPDGDRHPSGGGRPANTPYAPPGGRRPRVASSCGEVRLEVPRASRTWRWHAVVGDRVGLRVAVSKGRASGPQAWADTRSARADQRCWADPDYVRPIHRWAQARALATLDQLVTR